MTKEEFSNTNFRSEMYAEYGGHEYPVASANFDEYLFGLELGGYDDEDGDNLMWVRCENVERVWYEDHDELSKPKNE